MSIVAVLLLALSGAGVWAVVQGTRSIPVVSNVQGTGVGTVVTFRWSDPGLQSGDVYIVSIDGAPRPVQREGILVVDAVDHGRVCASVVVSRDGKSGRPSAERCVDVEGPG